MGKKFINEFSMTDETQVPARTLSGQLHEHSTKELHQHSCHQFLTIKDGVSLLVGEAWQQPLYGSMCALIPAGSAHRTVVIGEPITYQLLYISKKLFATTESHICLFALNNLGRALFDRLTQSNVRTMTQGLQENVWICF